MKKNAEINVAKANQAADIVAVQANETKLVGSKFTAMQAELTALPNVMTQVRKQLCPLVTMTHHYDSSPSVRERCLAATLHSPCQ